MSGPWSIPLRLSEVNRGPVRLRPEIDDGLRERLAKAIAVDALPSLEAWADLKPWLDGAELHGGFRGVVTQTCGLTLDPFDQPLQGDFLVRIVPPGSKAAPTTEGAEIAIDPEADDPPDVLEGDTIDVGAYLVEHMALAVDPFPRKPDAVFEAPEAAEILSPFAALKVLKGDDPAN